MTKIEEKEHAVLGPSGWDRWSTCPGSVVLEEGRPNPTSIYAAWGTAAHEITAECLTTGADAESYVDKVYTVAEHRIEVDMEMADACNICVGLVLGMIDAERGDVLMSEQEVPIGHLTGEKNATGTADVVGIVDHGKKLIVIDFKFGQGVPVYAAREHELYESWDKDAPDAIRDSNGEVCLAACRVCGKGEIELERGCLPNGQLAMYGLGALEKFGAIYDEIEEVELVIMQPRISEEPSTITITVEQLRDFGDEVTMAAGRVALAKNPPYVDTCDEQGLGDYLNPSEKACKFCRAKAICPALKDAVVGSMRAVVPTDPSEFEDLTLPKKAAALPSPSTYSNDTLAEAFRSIDLIEAWLSAVGEEMKARLMDRQQIPGFYLGEGKKGARGWDDPVKAEAELKKRLKSDEMYDKKVISVTKAEKLFKPKPKIWAKIVEEVGISQPDGKPKVCREGVDKNRPYELPSPNDFPDLTALPAADSEASALLAD